MRLHLQEQHDFTMNVYFATRLFIQVAYPCLLNSSRLPVVDRQMLGFGILHLPMEHIYCSLDIDADG